MTIAGDPNRQLPPGWKQNSDGTYTDPNGTPYNANQSGGFDAIGFNGQSQPGVHSSGVDNGSQVGGDSELAQITNLRNESSADSNAYNWGGYRGGAADDQKWDAAMAARMQNRAAPSVDLSNDAQSRGLMMAGANGYQSMLNGTGPSLADAQMVRGIQGAGAAGRMAQANASPTNMAAAGRQGIMGVAGGVANGVNAGVQQSLAEQNMATNGLSGASTGMYSGDINSAQQRASLALQNRAQNDSAAGMFQQNGINTGVAQMVGQNNRQGAAQRAQQQWGDYNQAQYGIQKANSARATNTAIAASEAVVQAAAAMSDRRAKRDVADATVDIEDAMNQLKPYTFSYKEPAKYGDGMRAGIMAQDLEKSAAGKSTIRETPDGKMVDIPKAVGLAMASVANLNKRLKNVETK